MCKKLSILLLALLPALVFAKDFGVQGHVWEISEPDIRESLVRSAAKVDWDSINKGVADRAETWAERLDPFDLPLASKTETAWVDPSLVLTGDIKAPFETEDGYEWRVVYPAGTRVNPLDSVRPVDNMLFFDGRDDKQVKFALDSLKNHQLDLMLVLTAGNPEKLSEKINRPVYYANTALIEKFQIQKVPSLLGVGTGARSLFLAVTTFKPPYTASLLDAAWTGLPAEQAALSDKTIK
jgi:conjugal transfer pilus assembly protein TraW